MNKKLIYKNENYKIELIYLYTNTRFKHYKIKIFYKNQLLKEWTNEVFTEKDLKSFLIYHIKKEMKDILKHKSWFYTYHHKKEITFCEYMRKSDFYKYNFILQTI